MKKRLAGKKALITGGGSGIGASIADLFSREGAVVGIDYSRNREGAEKALRKVKENGSGGIALKGDVSDPAVAREIVAEFVRLFDGVDILVNNSGIGSNTPDRVTEIDQADWDRVLAVNLTGAELMSRYAIPEMARRGGGSIVNISSIRGLLGNPNLASYSASKGGLVILTRQMACDYAGSGIRVNCICPGFTYTEMFSGYLDKQEDPDAAKRRFAEMAPLGRIGEPEEIAYAALFLASDGAGFITGAALPVDGGYTANGARDIL